MDRQSHSHPAVQRIGLTGRRGRIAATALALSLAGISGFSALPGASTTAQDGTGGATPTPPSPCVIPTATAGADDEPAAEFTTVVDATPAASPAASPVAASPEDALTADLLASAAAIASCLTEGDTDTLIALTSDAFRGQLIGAGEPVTGEEYTELSSILPPLPYTIVEVTDAERIEDDAATATVTYLIANQVRTVTWTFTADTVDGEPAWILDSEEAAELTVPEDTATIDITIADDDYDLSTDEIEGPTVALTAENTEEEDHELLVLRLDDGVSTDALLTTPGPALPEDVTFVGQATVPVDTTGILLLTNLEPGEYTIVCLLLEEDGIPHLAHGMEATFTVE